MRDLNHTWDIFINPPQDSENTAEEEEERIYELEDGEGCFEVLSSR